MNKFDESIKALRETKFAQEETEKAIKDLAAELTNEYAVLNKKHSDAKKMMEKIFRAMNEPFDYQFEALCQRTRVKAATVSYQKVKGNDQILIGGNPQVKEYILHLMKMAGENQPEKPRLVK